MKKIIAVVSLALAAGSAFAMDSTTAELTVLKEQGSLCKAERAATGKKSGDMCAKFLAYNNVITQGNPAIYWKHKIDSDQINKSNVVLFNEVLDLLLTAYE